MRADHNENTECDRDTAASWIARFRSGSASDEDRAAFALWLAQDKAHKQAMDSMLDMWQDLASVKQMHSDMPGEAANQSRHWLRASVATAACLAVALFIWPQNSPDTNKPIYYQTALGEQLSIELDDGSTTTLNTNSRMSVNFDTEHRRIELIRGEAFFKVAKDPSRPFDVDAGNARVTAIGTAFNVYRHGQTSSITVEEGVVRVTELGATGSRAPATEILHANQQLKATEQGLQTATATDVSQYTAWQRGELIASEMTLFEFVRQIERYHDTHILISDSSIAAMTISGVFPLDELGPILQALQLSLGLQVLSLNDNTLQLIKPAS
ncbi:MAG: FecR family protein [Proteobacteria bacterium]|nr:FecR family protein [Pseudomonadota bacterium]